MDSSSYSSSSIRLSASSVNYISMPCIYGHRIPSRTKRKSRLMKWFDKVFKGSESSGYGASEGHFPWLIGEDNQSRGEDEDLDRALELSLAEDIRKSNGYRGSSSNDEELARSLQETPNMSSYPPFNTMQLHPRGVCCGCKREIGFGQYIRCMNTFWHPQCFCCHSCGERINDFEIPANKDGLIEYRAHPFWKQKYCPSHECDNTAQCCSCERLESRKTKYVSLGDGRSLCLECLDSAVIDTGECQQLYHAIRDYYEGLNMKLDQQIPMLLVERQALNEAMEGEKNTHRHMPETRGLCLSEEHTVSSVHKKPKSGVNFILDMRTQVQKLTRKCEVTAILVLYGLPRLLTGSLLAHELMHGWLRLKGYRNLCSEVEEGLCQVLSHMWLESEVLPISRSIASTSRVAPLSRHSSLTSKKVGMSDIEKKLGEFFMHQISHDSSPAYGGGFRAAYSSVNRYGLRQTLDHIYLAGKFPG